MIKNQQAPTPRRASNHGLEVHSIFPTIQGEGPFAGHPAIFLRLAHCNLQCPLCDTEYTEGAEVLGNGDILNQVLHLTTGENLVVITGGEPFRQDLSEIIVELTQCGYKVQIETNGKLAPNAATFRALGGAGSNAHVVISPKTTTIAGLILKLENTSFKYVVQIGDTDEDGLPIHALGHPIPRGATVAKPPVNYAGTVYIQPADEKTEEDNRANMHRAVKSVLQNPTQQRRVLCLQMHKYAELA